MKKKVWGSILIVLSVLLFSINLYAQSEETFLPPDQEYGQKLKAGLMSETVQMIDDAVTANELSNVNALSLKKKVSDLASIDKRSGEAVTVTEESANEMSGLFNDVYSVLSVSKNRSNDKVNQITNKVDRLAAANGNFDSCNGLSNDSLKGKLGELIGNHRSLGYNEGRRILFTKIDNFGGSVKCVYTGRVINNCTSIPSANPPVAMNTEHTWPKSLGAGSEPAKSDLNHLYATDTFANSTRSSFPFGEVNEGSAKWKQGGSSFDGSKFMPREDHRGKVARAYFYFSTRYNKDIPDAQEKILKEWHKKYPVTAEEKERNERVFSFQGNRNPYVDRPEFVDKISNF